MIRRERGGKTLASLERGQAQRCSQVSGKRMGSLLLSTYGTSPGNGRPPMEHDEKNTVLGKESLSGDALLDSHSAN